MGSPAGRFNFSHAPNIYFIRVTITELITKSIAECQR
jgi:hypothetical protein